MECNPDDMTISVLTRTASFSNTPYLSQQNSPTLYLTDAFHSIKNFFLCVEFNHFFFPIKKISICHSKIVILLLIGRRIASQILICAEEIEEPLYYTQVYSLNLEKGTSISKKKTVRRKNWNQCLNPPFEIDVAMGIRILLHSFDRSAISHRFRDDARRGYWK